MDTKYIVYTAGKNGITVKRYSETLGLILSGFYDNNEELQGKIIDGLKVLTSKEIHQLVNVSKEDKIGFIIGSELYADELQKEIEAHYGRGIEVILPADIQRRYWVEIVISQKKYLGNKYAVTYNTQAADWVDNLMTEVEYWVKTNASANGVGHQGYVERYLHQDDTFQCNRLQKNLQAGDIVLDIGCGICTKYGKRLETGNLNLIAIDPLSYFYNLMNQKSMHSREETVKFGLFEFLSAFYPRDYADVILIDNALDHCIDPFKSVLECLIVLKTGGILSMQHRRCEAVYEGYEGLHKWNIDVNDDNEFIIWNKENMVNVNKIIQDFANVKVILHENYERKYDCIDINIEKRTDFDISCFYGKEEENEKMGWVIQVLMKLLANEKINGQFQQLLEMV